MLNSVELVAKMVGELEGPALALLGFLTYKDGWCPLAVLNQAATGPQGEHFDWPQYGTLTPVGRVVKPGPGHGRADETGWRFPTGFY